jgi:hypothetical protein
MAEYIPGEGARTRLHHDRRPRLITGGQLLSACPVPALSRRRAPRLRRGSASPSHDAASGVKVTVFTGGVQLLTASGSITAGANVEAAASGQVASHTNGTNDVNIVGLALTSATNGNKVQVQLVRG